MKKELSRMTTLNIGTILRAYGRHAGEEVADRLSHHVPLTRKRLEETKDLFDGMTLMSMLVAFDPFLAFASLEAIWKVKFDKRGILNIRMLMERDAEAPFFKREEREARIRSLRSRRA